MKCIACTKCDLKFNQAFSKLGMAHCKDDPPATFVSLKFERVCSSFKPAPAATVVKREMWAEKI